MTTESKGHASRIKELEAANSKYVAEISRLEARLGEMGGEIGRLQAEAQQKRGVRAHASGLYRAIDLSITSRIERKGYIRKAPKKARAIAPIADDVISGKDVTALHHAARQYDASAFFRYKASKSGMRLQYRVFGALYRAGRNSAKYTLKKTYRLVRRGAR